MREICVNCFEGYLQFLIPVLAAVAGSVIASVLNKLFITIGDKRNGKKVRM